MRVVVLASQLQVGNNPDAPGVVMTLTGAAIALFLLIGFNWVVGHALTLAHEGGHALMAVFLGGKVTSIKTYADRTGETATIHPRQFGTLDTAVRKGSGYIAPPVFGFVAAQVLGHGRPEVVLWVTAALLAVMLPSARSLFTAASIVTFGFVLIVVLARGTETYRLASAVTWTWLLLAGGLFQLLEHFDEADDFKNMSEKIFGPFFLALVYTAATLLLIFYAGLVMVGAREPFL